MSKLVSTLYRLLLRRANQLDKCGGQLNISMPIDKSSWLANGGGHAWATPAPEYSKDSMARLLPWLANASMSNGVFDSPSLRQSIRDAFRSKNDPSDPLFTDAIDRAFQSLKVLEEQLYMKQSSSSATTRGVRVDVTSAFVGRHSDLDSTFDPDSGVPNKNYFTYRIRVSNVGDQIVQLLSRHWIIKNSKGSTVMEVKPGAKGVVGCTPILKPSTCFSYYSGTDLDDEAGTMEGAYEMAVLNSKGLPEDRFQALVAPFKFLVPEGNNSAE